MGSDGEESDSDEYWYDNPNYNEDEYYVPDHTADLQSEKYYYTVLKEEDIKKCQNDDITQISSVLSIPRKSATVLLRSFNWSVTEILDNWFANEDKLRKSVGLVINEREKGPKAARRYEKRLVRSYVEQSRTRRWCPSPGCKNAVELLADVVIRRKNWDVVCDCSHEFCWNCRGEAHGSVDCATVLEWEKEKKKKKKKKKKKERESENVKWMLAYTKPHCPKCNIQIEKTNGCDDHVTCRSPCGHQFCWLCLGDWREHSRSTCYSLLSCRKAENVNKMSDLEKSMIRRYEYYFKRWNINQKFRRIAQSDLDKFRNIVHREKKDLFDNYKIRRIEEAWVQIIECRRVLRWSYVYGYYLHEEGETVKENLFEYLQGQAESALERLHQCAEEGLKPFINDENADAGLLDHEFNKYYSELVNLTRVTKTFFGNLVTGLQNGLEVGTDDD